MNKLDEQAGAELCQAQGKLWLARLCFSLVSPVDYIWFARFAIVGLVL